MVQSKKRLKYLEGFKKIQEKSRIREKPNLLTDADSRTDTNLKRLCDLSFKIKKLKIIIKNERVQD